MNRRVYVTTSIPYVNAAPHLGHALEFVQADVLGRHHRLRDREVRLLSGTDDLALKNVTAARSAGVDVASWVHGHAAAFRALQVSLQVQPDDFIQTGSDPRHRPGVERLWRQTSAQGDFYRRSYAGLYCLGCEQFYAEPELTDRRCPEHGTPVETVSEDNWFFRLSRYTTDILVAISSGQVRIEPAERCNEIVALLQRGLDDISVSRPIARAQGWGIEVPGDATQVVYVWWEALCNYVTALDYGGDQVAYRRWWLASSERVHVVGKGITRFHAVYWLALLLSAGQPLPTTIAVHDYLTLEGRKIAKSGGRTVDPDELIADHGSDAVRWWLCSDVARVGDTDFTVERLHRRYAQDLAGGIGNLVNRTCALVTQFADGRVRPDRADPNAPLTVAAEALPAEIDLALDRFDLRQACTAILSVVSLANRFIEDERPWELARRARVGSGSSAGSPEASGRPAAAESLDTVLATLVDVCRRLAVEISPFVPAGAGRLRQQLGAGEIVNRGTPVFPRQPVLEPEQDLT